MDETPYEGACPPEGECPWCADYEDQIGSLRDELDEMYNTLMHLRVGMRAVLDG